MPLSVITNIGLGITGALGILGVFAWVFHLIWAVGESIGPEKTVREITPYDFWVPCLILLTLSIVMTGGIIWLRVIQAREKEKKRQERRKNKK